MNKRKLKLVYLRRLNGYNTQEEMAKALGMSLNSYHRKESGQREFTEEEIIKLLDLLNVEFKDIFMPSSKQNEE